MTWAYCFKPGYLIVLSLGLEVDFPRVVGASHLALGGVAIGQGKSVQSINHLNTAVAVSRDLKNRDDLVAVIGTLSCVEINIGELDLARDYLVESLEIVADIRGIWGASYTLPIVALYLATQGDVERAVEVYTLMLQYPIPANSQFHQNEAVKFIYEAAAALPPDVVAEAEERGRQGDPFEMAAKLLEELSI